MAGQASSLQLGHGYMLEDRRPAACRNLLGRTRQRGKATEARARSGERRGVPSRRTDGNELSTLQGGGGGGARAPPAHTLRRTPPALRPSHRRQKASARLSRVSFSLSIAWLSRAPLTRAASSSSARRDLSTPSPTKVRPLRRPSQGNPVLLPFRDWNRILPSGDAAKVGVVEFLNGVGKGVEAHAAKLEEAVGGDLQRLLETRTLRLKKLGIPCKHVRL